jgi:hypothetical protein
MYFKDPIMRFSKYFVDSLGMYGIFFIVFFMDLTPCGLTCEPLLLVGVKGGLEIYAVFITACIASIL